MSDSAQDAVGALLGIERALRRCQSRRELVFAAANDTRQVLRFEQAVVWAFDALGRIHVEAVSGLTDIDANASYALWLQELFNHVRINASQRVREFTPDDLPVQLVQGQEEWLAEHSLHCRLESPQGALLGGLWISRGDAFDEGELARAEWLAEAIGFSLWAWQRERLHWRQRLRLGLSRRQKLWALGTAALFICFPVRLSALAPAEVVPEQPVPVTAPTDGVVQKILVAPNQPVQAGQPLVQFDDTVIRNRVAVAQKSLDIARAERQRAVSKAFSDDASKAELQMLDARVGERTAEMNYLTALLARTQIVAPQPGIAIFSDADEWRGKPVQPGERIMTVADPAKAAVAIFLAPDDAIQLDVGSTVKLYLNAAPLSSFAGEVTQTAYETASSPDGQPAYVLRARLIKKEAPPRIGQKGTAKVSAGWVPLSYYLLRKPLRALRRAAGI
jgi:hypothetical protein